MKRPKPSAKKLPKGDIAPGRQAMSDADRTKSIIAAALGDRPTAAANDLSLHASPVSLSLGEGAAPPALAKAARGRRKAAGAAPVMAATPVAPVATAAPSAASAVPRPPATPARQARPKLAHALKQRVSSEVDAPTIVARPDEIETMPEVAITRPIEPAVHHAVQSPEPSPGSEAEHLPEPGNTRTSEPTPPREAPNSSPGSAPQSPDPVRHPIPDMEALARNMGRYIEQSGKAVAAYLAPRESGRVPPTSGEEIVGTMNSLGRIAESWIANPTKMLQAQAALSTQLFGLWSASFAAFGARPDPVVTATRATDRRFAAPEWQSTPAFDFLHQAYLMTTDWAKAMVADAEGVDQSTRDKAAFYLRQISSALSPANFLVTNPELLKETFNENGENLVRGMAMLAEDIAAGKGDLKIRQSDATKFTLGIDMASTPGKVVFRNDLMELIQYAPSTETVLRRPLLIVPPWINKFYVLDLNKDKSFIRWAVSQRLTVFVISWVNPDARHAAKDWDAYMREGIFAAIDAIEAATGETEVSTVGYCVGGTLLAATLAFMGSRGDRRVTSSTFLTTQVDFDEAGDLKVFADEAQISAVEKQMQKDGYLAGAKMANAFNMLRPDDLIWSYSINTYLKGKSPAAFDLLAWNADSTRMSAANHAFYLRNCYLENKLTKGEMVIAGERLDLGAVTIPIYDLAAKEDHIAPARSVYTGSKFFGGPVRYVMAGSGHIAGVVNPPAKAKYQYWSGGECDGPFERWVKTATETKGTWWLDWIGWITSQAPEAVPARTPGEGGLPALCDAPGEYVRVQS